MSEASNPSWMLYGANGFTGSRIAAEAVRRGLRPLLAGRSPAGIVPLAEELGCAHRTFPLRDAAQVAAELEGMELVLHCAGPFSATALPMLDACLEAGAHYLDITGEIEAIEAAAERHARAVRRGITLLPAVGFEVVAGDCLAAMLAARMPAATHLELAVSGVGTVSAGTARTVLEQIPKGGCVRVGGRLERVPLAWKTREITFPDGPRSAAIIPSPDVATAWYSTGIGNIEVYMVMPRRQVNLLRLTRPLLRALRLLPVPWVRPLLRWFAGGQPAAKRPPGAFLWGRVRDAEDQSVEGTLHTPEGYEVTVLAALAAVERTLLGDFQPGFATPSKAFGADFALSLPGTVSGLQEMQEPR